MNIKKHTVTKFLKTFQTDRYGLMRPITLMNEFQSLADIHAEKLGLGRTFCIEKNLAWVVTHYLVDIIKMPNENQELFLSTWPCDFGGLKATRDFEIRTSDDELLVRATSQWILIDMQSRRPLKLVDVLPVLPESLPRAYDKTFDKFEDFDADKVLTFKCRYDDVDVNQHINNAVYAVWATESVGFDFRNVHKLKRIDLNFKKEISYDVPSVDVGLKIDGNTTHHKISSNGGANASVVCEWEAN